MNIPTEKATSKPETGGGGFSLIDSIMGFTETITSSLVDGTLDAAQVVEESLLNTAKSAVNLVLPELTST